MVKRKVSLGGGGGGGTDGRAIAPDASGARPPSVETLELFFNTGIVFHELALDIPDVVSSFCIMQGAGAATPHGQVGTWSVRRAEPGEDPDVEISIVDHLGELGGRWLPVPYPFTNPFAVQIFLAQTASGEHRAMLAIDTLEVEGTDGRYLDARKDGGRPFRALDKLELNAFLDHSETRDLVRKLEKSGVDKALFKIAALLEAVNPSLPKIKLSRVDDHTPIPVSLVLDFGNSRSTALLVEGRDAGVFGVPLEMRSLSNPFDVSRETFDSRVTFLPSPFDKSVHAVGTRDSFNIPSIARMGREALDRALEAPHRYLCTLSGPKRYLWDDRQTDERWHFAHKFDTGSGEGEYRPVAGRILKYVPEESGGLYMREDGPQAPADPRYAPRSMMLFAIVEILFQAYAQINSAPYRHYQGKEGNPRVLGNLVLTYPSAMREEERRVYEGLVRNAVILACHVLNIRQDLRPNFSPSGQFEPFLFVDEALAAQMVFVFQEVEGTFSGSMEELISVYGHVPPKVEGAGAAAAPATLRVASVDIGGGTSDVMIAEYQDVLPGTGTSLRVKKLFQDGVSIAGDEVCRAIVEDVVFDQILGQLAATESRGKFLHLFGEGDAGHGSAWRTLRAKLVPYFWLPLARCYWSVAEGFALPDHSPEKMYLASEVFRMFGVPTVASHVLEEADRFLTSEMEDFPGFLNLFLKFDAQLVERTVERVLREPLRRYADILAQYDVDLLVLAGRTAALPCIKDLFVREMPVAPPRIRTMARYRVGEWYPSMWKDQGHIKDPKSTVAAGAAVLHLASKNRLSGFLIDTITEADERPIYGLYQDVEPHVARANELFRDGDTSPGFVYTNAMRIGFRNVDSEEMDGSPLFEVRPATPDVEAALLEDRVSIQFARGRDGSIAISSVKSQRGQFSFDEKDFVLSLRTATFDKYWLDTGVFDVRRA